MNKEKKRKRTVYKCPICKGPVIIERLNAFMIFVICESCNAVVDYYDSVVTPVGEKKKKKKILYIVSK